MGDTQIKEVLKHRLLGLMISSDFSWNSHTKIIQEMAFKRLGALRRHKFDISLTSTDARFQNYIQLL